MWKQQYSMYRSSAGDKLLPVLGSMVQISLSLVAVYLPKMILDCVTARTSPQTLFCRIGITGGLWLLLSAANLVIRNAITVHTQTQLYTEWIPAWEEKTMDLDYEIFVSHQGKVLMEKARLAVSSPNWGMVTYLSRLTDLLAAAGGLLAYSTILCTLHPLAVLALLLLFGIELSCSVRTEQKKQTLKDRKAEAGRKLNYIAYGTRGLLEGKDIRMYHMAGWLREMAQLALKRKRGLERMTAGYELQKLTIGGILILVRDGCAYGYLLHTFFHSDMSVGNFSLYFTAIAGLGGWLSRLTEGISRLQEAGNYVRDYQEYMQLGGKAASGRKGVPYPDRAKELQLPIGFRIQDVSYAYTETDENGREQRHQVLEHLDLDIAPGEKLGIVGINGAGKTTLIKLLCGLLRPQQGQIYVNGIEQEAFSPQEYYELFSAVFQNSGVLPVSVADNIALNTAGKVDRERLEGCIRAAGLEEKIRSLPRGADTCLVRRITGQGTELSGGQLQRLLLARALYKEAPVLILDEPTAALDPLAEQDIYRQYQRFTAGKTAVFISHRLASTRFCDRIILLDRGRIAESGTHEQLLALGGKYAEMFWVQSRYYQEGGKEGICAET